MSSGSRRSLDDEAKDRTNGPTMRMGGLTVGQPVVHFEIIGKDPATLRSYYGELFGWAYDVGDATTPTVSQPGTYGS
jgi:hypothetical protein